MPMPQSHSRTDDDVCSLPSVLHTIVCGFEHSGTTLVGELLRQHEDLDSGFEGGLLLNDSPRQFPDCQPFYTNMLNTWKLSDEAAKAACETDRFAEAYCRLRDASPILKNKSVRLYDKTPRYMSCLDSVLTRAPQIPVIAIVRDFRAVMWSSFKRLGNGDMATWQRETLPRTLRHTYSYAAGLREAMRRFGLERILVVQYERLCLDPTTVGTQIFDHINLKYDERFSRFGKARYDLVYGQDVQRAYIFEYRDRLPKELQLRIIDYFSEFNPFFFNQC